MNDVIDFFLADERAAIQLQSADYVARISQQAGVTSSGAPAPPATGQFFSFGGAPPTPTFSVAGVTPGPTTPTTPTTPNVPNAVPKPPDVANIPQGSVSASSDQQFFTTPPTTVGVNTDVKVQAGSRVAAAVELQDYTGQLYLLAYYPP